MKYSIEELWNGNIAPAETCGVGDPEIHELISLMSRNKIALTKALDEKQKPLFEKYLDCAEEYTELVSMHAFREGFCIAANLISEALSS